ncbi:MAG: alpha/beta hydrolase [Ktedonobacteraceae bacterium]|nr:alpha/beta hydrolase [Ktedonobacteraceae bacterium]
MQFFERIKQFAGFSANTHKALRLAYGPATQQFGELYLPETSQPSPIVVLIHGGFWHTQYRLSLMTGLAIDLARRGIAAWNIEYRRVGDSGGGWPNTLLDVAAATDYLQTIASTYALDLGRVVTLGHSAGGHLALWLAARSRLPSDSPLATTGTPLALAGVVSQAGVVDLEHGWRLRLGNNAVRALLGGSPSQVPERYAAASPAALLPLGVPQVLIHGSWDTIVPLELSQAYEGKAMADEDQITLIELPDTDHFALIDATSKAWEVTVREIEKLFQSS